MNPLAPFIAWLARRRAAKIVVAEAQHDGEAILEALQKIADHRDRISAELAEAQAEIERLTPLAVAYDYLEPPAGREMAEAKLAEATKRLEAIRDYPKKGDSRRTEDGYPLEIVYDEFAYRRMVDSYREVAVSFLASKEASHGR